MAGFSQDEILRYARHFSVADIGPRGQEKIRATRVLLVGAGGIGSPAALYLTAAGIGKLGIIDHDAVEVSNLQRQILFRSTDIGRRKVDVAETTLHALNPLPTIVPYPYALSPENALSIFAEYDYILDGSDNYPTRYLVGDAAQKAKKLLISASVFHLGGQLAFFDPYHGPCYRCLYPDAPPADLIPNSSQAGVLGVTPGILALLAVNQLFMDILGLDDRQARVGTFVEFHGKDLSLRHSKIPPRPTCLGCQSKDAPRFTLIPKPTPVCPSKGGPMPNEISASTLNTWLKTDKPFVLIDVREPHERELSRIEPSIALPLGNFQDPELIEEHASIFADPQATYVTYCHAGVRSAKAANILAKHGFQQVFSLTGGIEAWQRLSTSKAH